MVRSHKGRRRDQNKHAILSLGFAYKDGDLMKALETLSREVLERTRKGSIYKRLLLECAALGGRARARLRWENRLKKI